MDKKWSFKFPPTYHVNNSITFSGEDLATSLARSVGYVLSVYHHHLKQLSQF